MADQADIAVTPQPIPEGNVVGREERIEYRDQDGNLLSDEQVQELVAEGKASFQTKYETSTRLVDAEGNEIPSSGAVAPDHPDVEGQNPDTKGVQEGEPKSQPAEAEVPSGESSKERDMKAKPASDANEATARGE